MSSLGDKVKNILHSGESKDTTSTQHPPGSFPTEEMEPSQTTEGYSKGYEQNKLHKADDPRGHAHKDSGVGLTESTDPTSYKPTQDPISERRDPLEAERRNDPLQSERRDPLESQRRDPLETERRNDPLDRTTGSATAGGLGETTNLAGKEGTTATGTTAPSSQENPYWGDLPGGGVHNTVIGHGSPEDEAERHRQVHTGATEPTRTAGTLESGTFLHQRGDDHKTSSTNPHDAQRQAQEDPSRDSHLKEGATAAGAAGAGALGAHELNKRRHADETTKTESHPEDNKEHKDRSFPLIDHKDKESHHKELKEEKHKEPKEKGESKLGALFHRRGSKDKTEEQAKAEHEADKERHHHSKAAPMAAAGAGAAWAAHQDHDDKTRRETAHQEPAVQHATQYPASGLDSTRDYSQQHGATQQPQHDSHRGAGLATGAAAGLGAGALAGHYGQRDKRTAQPAGHDAQRVGPTGTPSTTNQTAQPYQQQGSHGDHSLTKGTAAGLSAGALASQAGHHHSGQQKPGSTQPSALDSTQRDQPANFSHKDPAGQQHDSHRGAGLAAGTAAGLGAGALASRSGREHEQQPGLESNRGFESQAAQPQPTQTSTMQPTSQTYQQQEPHSHRGRDLAAGTAAGLGAGALASRAGREHQSGDQHGLESNRGLESQGTHLTQSSTIDPTSQSHPQESSHRGTGLAAGTAAGLGAAGLASYESNKQDDRFLSNDSSMGSQSRTTGTGGPMGTSSSAFNSSKTEPFSQGQTQSGQGHHPTLAERANAGKYNTLSSGTPSGVAYDDDLNTTRSTQPASVEPQKKDHHYGTAAGLGASAAGAGTAAAMSRHKDEKPVEKDPNQDKKDLFKSEPQTERKLDEHRPITGAVAPGSGLNKPVIHKCQKCGEDNDISSYFTSK
ncbi:hypothetical protein F53441_3356 [Fusarium austroafricanum]|uniref:Uncharacterized protein n=1 Tax=Fusarium austroafricanum TaxID=2364996 RepID=A0A8H4KPC5_9HYPO|nr:hypothetical protein F53441_3356 [Fusarium austroafricanum]